jgi:membrane fusion protein
MLGFLISSMNAQWCTLDMNDNLFRKEVYVAQDQDKSGGIMLYQPLPARLIAWGASAICLALVVFLCVGRYTDKASVKGFLEPTNGLVAVWAPHAGLLREVYVVEGQTVRRGDPLFVVATERASLQALDTQAQVLANLQDRKSNLQQSLHNEKQLMELELQSLAAGQRKLTAERIQVELEIDTAQKKLLSQQKIMLSYRTLQKNHFVSDLEAEQAQHRMLDYEAALQALEKRRINLQEDIDRAEQEVSLRRLRGEKEKQSIQRQIFALEQEITEQHQKQASVVLAPNDGVVASLPVRRDQMVPANQHLLTLVPPDAVLQATLLVPTKAAGFLREQQEVVLRYTAFPYQKFGTVKGAVTAIDKSLTLPGEPSVPVNLAEPVYRVTVALAQQQVNAYGKRHALRAGMTLDADVQLETRSLLEWIFAPVWSFARKTGSFSN